MMIPLVTQSETQWSDESPDENPNPNRQGSAHNEILRYRSE